MNQEFSFSKDGVTIIDLLDKEEFNYVTLKICNHIRDGFGIGREFNIYEYHKWFERFESKRDYVLSPSNRHFPANFWKEIDLENKIKRKIETFYGKELSIWDEGYGTSAFRLVRPFHNDGYPPSKKSWGPAGQIISATIPIYGFTKKESQGFILGSHKKEYDSYLDPKQKFCKEERRLKDYKKYDYERFNLSIGQCIVFHWETIHTEQIIGDCVTRLALELRYESK